MRCHKVMEVAKAKISECRRAALGSVDLDVLATSDVVGDNDRHSNA